MVTIQYSLIFSGGVLRVCVVCPTRRFSHCCRKRDRGDMQAKVLQNIRWWFFVSSSFITHVQNRTPKSTADRDIADLFGNTSDLPVNSRLE